VIDSKPGEGTRTGIEIPDVQVGEELTTAGDQRIQEFTDSRSRGR